MINFLYAGIIAFLLIEFSLERWLDILNKSRWRDTLPEALVGIYDAEKYRQSIAYEKAYYNINQIVAFLGTALMLLAFCFGFFGWLDTYIRTMTNHPILLVILYFAVIGAGTQLLSFPIEWYKTFVIEERFGFNKTTPKLFVIDTFKSLFLGMLMGGSVLALLTWLYLLTGDWFWILGVLCVTILSLLITVFYSSLIVPLFNKQTPLEEGELRDRIDQFAREVNFHLDNIYLIDGSKRSTKANAYFTGLGKRKRIVLYDTLIKDLTINEIVAVLAHEVGHYKKKHVLKSMGVSIITLLLTFYLFSIVCKVPAFYQVLGAKEGGFHLSLITFGLMYLPLSLVFQLLSNYLSRKHEFEADTYAVTYTNSHDLGSALKKLSVSNLSNLTPHPLYVFFYYSHPPLLERLKNVMDSNKVLKEV